MAIDATFWVAISFFIFVGLIFYLKIPLKIKSSLNESVDNIKNQIEEAEKLRDEAKNMLDEHEKKIGGSKAEIKLMIDDANQQNEKSLIKANEEFHKLMDSRKKSTDDKIRQLKSQANKDIKDASVKIAIESVERLLKNSLDKSKLDKLYQASIEETKLALKKKSS
jgi:F-type H+-transporting ATPase subunit b